MNLELISQLATLFFIVAAGPLVVVLISLKQGNI
jgi:hypothetical protein